MIDLVTGFFYSRRVVAGVAAGILAGLVITSVSTASTATSEAALAHCPSVEDEIVDLEMLGEALRGSTAVGLFEKVKLKRNIDELLTRLESWHDGKRSYTLDQLEEQYNVLLMRIASHIQHKDQVLHQQLCNAWLQIWLDLEDSGRFREKFAG